MLREGRTVNDVAQEMRCFVMGLPMGAFLFSCSPNQEVIVFTKIGFNSLLIRTELRRQKGQMPRKKHRQLKSPQVSSGGQPRVLFLESH